MVIGCDVAACRQIVVSCSFRRIRDTLRIAPAVEAADAARPWTIGELPEPARRGRQCGSWSSNSRSAGSPRLREDAGDGPQSDKHSKDDGPCRSKWGKHSATEEGHESVGVPPLDL